MTRRTKKAWTKCRELISKQARSGQAVKAFCDEHGLCRSYFFVWKKRLGEAPATKFLEVQLKEAVPSATKGTCVEIRPQNGRSLVVGRGFDAEHVRALLPALGQARPAKTTFALLPLQVRQSPPASSAPHSDPDENRRPSTWCKGLSAGAIAGPIRCRSQCLARFRAG